MLEKVLQCTNLGNQLQILYVLKLLSKGDFNFEELRGACASEAYSFSESFPGIILLLQWLDVILVNTHIQLQSNIDEMNFTEKFCGLLFLKMAVENQLHNFFNSTNLIIDKPSKSIIIRNKLIDFKFSSLRNLLIRLGLFEKNDTVFNQFLINKKFLTWFTDNVIPLIDKSSIQNRTLLDLNRSNEAKHDAGVKAEEFVLGYEIKKRTNHPKVKNIKIISNIDIGAGYDIQSYKTDDSILLDKFIEVKSYEGIANFYWSKNEIETSKKEKDNYFLYLVNRKKISNLNYEPTIIQNPYEKIFNNKQWIGACQNWKFQATSPI